MARAGGINGLGVGMATAGGVLVYAGLRDITPLDALRDITSGRLPTVERKGSATADEILARQSGGPGSKAPSVFKSGGALVTAARRYVGGPYRFGGTDPRTGLDCSALVQRAFKDIGIPDCPRTSGQQYLWRALTTVRSAGDVQPGDLVFWSGHVAIATQAGGGTVVGALNRKTGIREGPTKSNGAGRIIGYRRYAGAQSAAPGTGSGDSW